MFPYIISNDTITVVHQGKPFVVRKGSPNFKFLRDALTAENWTQVPKFLKIASSINEWAKGKFTVKDDSTILYDGEVLPDALNERIFNMVSEGKNPSPLFKFWERLQKNPSKRSIEQLWPFLQHENIPLTDDGCFLAYKGINKDWTDIHTGKIVNKPGTVHEMPRNKISDDPNHACHFGFHVGALEYATSFGAGGRVVICKVAPENVVCIPYDHNAQKMRVCRYEVIGNYSAPLDSLHEEEEDIDVDYGFLDEDEGSEHEFDHFDAEELIDRSIEDLRRYATHHIGLVGASKIPGGKLALINKILETRGY